jgi:Ca2+-binding RTX toxin-like protein
MRTLKRLQQFHDSSWLFPQDTIVGTNGKDTLVGTDGNDLIKGLKGNDLIEGGAGNDTLKGGAGSDTLLGGVHDDALDGGGGHDSLNGGEGFNVFYDNYGDGRDTLDGTDGSWLYQTLVADWSENGLDISWTNTESGTGYVDGNQIKGMGRLDIESGSGDDYYLHIEGDGGIIRGNGGDDYIQMSGALARDNRIEGGSGDDTLIAGFEVAAEGGDGNDWIYSRAYQQYASGGAGNDTLTGTARFSYMHGGDGDDLIKLQGEQERTAYGDAGNDTILGGGTEATIYGGAGDDWLQGGGGFSTTVRGDEGNDTIRVTGWHAALYGDAGKDLFLYDTHGNYTVIVQDLVHGEDRIGLSAAYFAPGDGDTVVEGGVVVAGPGGFSSAAELVIVRKYVDNVFVGEQVAAAIGSATDAYDIGDRAIFVVQDGDSVLFAFESKNNDAVVSADEIVLIGQRIADSETFVDDYVFV